MKKIIGAFIGVCFFSISASDLAEQYKKIAFEKERVDFLQEQHLRFTREIDLCEEKIDRLHESFYRTHRMLRKMKRNRQNAFGERKPLVEPMERSLLLEKPFFVECKRYKAECRDANAILVRLQEQKISVQKAIRDHSFTIIQLQRAALQAVKIQRDDRERELVVE